MRSPALLAIPLLALVSISQPALAAGSGREKAEARALVTQAKKAMHDRRFADAVAALKKAERLDPSPALAVDLAQAQIAAGKLVEAQKTLAPVAADGSPAARKAREAAKQALDDLRARVPTVKVRLAGPAAGSASVLIDGVEVDGSREILLDPGDHTVGAEARGFVAVERDLRVAEGAHERVTLDLAPVGQSAPAPAASAEPAEPRKAGSRVPGAVVTVVGAAGLVVGGIFGGLAFKATSDAKSECNGNACPSAASADVSRSKMFGNVSTGAFIAGGAVTAIGIGLLIAAPGGGGKSDDARPSARLSPWVGPGVAGVGAQGSF